MKVVRLSALHTGRLYPPGIILGTRFCKRLNQPQGHSAAGRNMSMKNSYDIIGNRTRDLPACSAVANHLCVVKQMCSVLHNVFTPWILFSSGTSVTALDSIGRLAFRRQRKIAKNNCWLCDVGLSVRLSARTNSAPTTRIFMKLDIWGFFETLSRKYRFN